MYHLPFPHHRRSGRTPTSRPFRAVRHGAPPRAPRHAVSRLAPRFAFALVTLAAALSIAPPAGAAAIRLAVGTRIANAPLQVAASRGYFEREEVEVELSALGDGEDVIELFAEEEIDLATLTADGLLRAGDGGVDLRGAYVLGISGTSDALVAREEIRDTRLLQSRRVAFTPDSAGELLLRQALQRKGRRLDDIEPVPLAPDAAAAALIAGEVDAAALAEPALSTLPDDQGLRVLATAADPVSADTPTGLVSDLLVGTDDGLAASKESVKSIVRAIERAVAWMRRNPDEAVQLVAERYGIEPARAARALDGVTLLDVDDNMQLLRGEFQKSFSAMSEVLAAARSGRPREVPSANRYLELSALRQVAAGR